MTPGEFESGRKQIGQKQPFDGNPDQGEPSSKSKKNLLGFVFKTWPKGPIQYKIDSVFNAAERTAIAGGMADIMDNTCVVFIDGGANPVGDYIWITTGSDGCFVSGSGYTPGRGAHLMNLVREPWCSQVS